MPPFRNSRLFFVSLGKRYWAPRSLPQKAVLAVAALLIIPLVLWKILWLPSQSYLEKAELDYTEVKKEQRWLQANPQPASAAGEPAGASKPFATILTETTQAYRIPVTALTQEADNQFQLHTADASFAAIVNWLYALENQYHLVIYELEINKTAEGTANVRLVIADRSPE